MASTKKPKAKKARTKPEPTTAFHIQHADGTHHAVGIGNLRVIIVPDDTFFFAQGLEIDYAAQGNSLEDVKKQFEDGLTATIQQHLQAYGNIEKLLKVAPAEVWKDMLLEPSAKYNEYFQVTAHEVIHEAFPFDGINYLVAAQSCGREG